ncbi:MAG: tryptophan 2,3-dioxygenase family protein, partial [Thermoplasmatota archaeon]
MTANAHGCPFHGNDPEGPQLPGTADTDYERYLRVDELLSLQKKPEERAHPDELMFQTIHQSFEIWLKLVLEELDRIKDFLDKDDKHSAVRLLRR